jgi:hypothetical protein
MMGTRTPAKLADWAKQNPKGRVGSFADAAKFAEVAVLAVKGTAATDALGAAGAANLAGKTVIDATNPIADLPPINGVLRFFTSLDESLMERLQREFGDARFVKAFNSVGSICMVNPEFKGARPTMFICGNDEGAKKSVTGILEQFGWDTADMGKAEAARAIEKARAGGGPTLLELITLRMEGHAVHDDAFYVPKDMFEEWAKSDPMERVRTWLREHADLSDEEEDELSTEIKKLLSDAIKRAGIEGFAVWTRCH